uniref:Uncharacterized protein n=1 Tax=Eutreptiella gymnastica TaxID=73025 RepID=A0A7S4CX30_9EUGL
MARQAPPEHQQGIALLLPRPPHDQSLFCTHIDMADAFWSFQLLAGVRTWYKMTKHRVQTTTIQTAEGNTNKYKETILVNRTSCGSAAHKWYHGENERDVSV